MHDSACPTIEISCRRKIKLKIPMKTKQLEKDQNSKKIGGEPVSLSDLLCAVFILHLSLFLRPLFH
jgi:hypothetical protein